MELNGDADRLKDVGEIKYDYNGPGFANEDEVLDQIFDEYRGPGFEIEYDAFEQHHTTCFNWKIFKIILAILVVSATIGIIVGTTRGNNLNDPITLKISKHVPCSSTLSTAVLSKSIISEDPFEKQIPASSTRINTFNKNQRQIDDPKLTTNSANDCRDDHPCEEPRSILNYNEEDTDIGGVAIVVEKSVGLLLILLIFHFYMTALAPTFATLATLGAVVVTTLLYGAVTAANKFKNYLESKTSPIAAAFLQGWWINEDGDAIHVKGKKCIFAKSRKEHSINLENENFVIKIGNYKYTTQQSTSSEEEVIWTRVSLFGISVKKECFKWTPFEKRRRRYENENE